ncbi:cryptochrome/photolyase family protein [Haliea atlantica]
MTALTLYLFRHDLRLRDLPGLHKAAERGRVLPLYILDEAAAGDFAPGGASRWWLHHSLRALQTRLAERGGTLLLRRGASADILRELIERTGADAVYFSRGYTPWERALEGELHRELTELGIDCRRFGGSLLHEPEHIANQSGEPYKVFTPFWRACRRASEPAMPLPEPDAVDWAEPPSPGDDLEDWQLLPDKPNWAAGWETLWTPGEDGASERLARFLGERLEDYASGRDFPAQESTSRLSPHLHFGELSPRTLWHAVRAAAEQHPGLHKPADKFLSELGWREFSAHLLFHFPALVDSPFRPDFRHFPWGGSKPRRETWQQGRTGYPVVDAGMRELWQTGYMHNRVRMIVASFLTKHLLTHWQRGERWFHDTLVDADMGNNLCSWQWAAGCGADAAPYFRIFNPVLQGKKFDPEGHYVRRWVPELAALPDRHLHAPWEAPASVLQEAGVTLGEDYPEPVVDHREARETALGAWQTLRERAQNAD